MTDKQTPTPLAYEVDIQDDHDYAPQMGSQLCKAAIITLQHEGVVPPATMTIVLTDDHTIQTLNNTYRGYDKPTDVLSFPDGESPHPNAPIYLGDIIISVPYAQRQANQINQSLLAELCLLVVHGTLHLLGHDHGESAEKTRMWAAQTTILSLLTPT